MNVDLIDYGAEVKAALADGAAVVAIESSLINRNLPAADRLLALGEATAAVRAKGALPAVLGIVGGRVKIGMSDADCEVLATANDVAKVSRRDLATIIARGGHGATTVASSMILAHLAGITVFVTGGIGGVHRGYEETMDVSADLEELARTPVCVVCAGAKVILDLPRTLEYLETKGVPVIGYRTDDFPAYYAPGGLPVDARLDSPEEIAQVMKTKWALGIEGGLVVVTPLDLRSAMDAKVLERSVERALAEATAKNVTGKDITPFLLARLANLTEGGVKGAGLAAIRVNAAAGAEIARAYAALGQAAR